MTLVSMSTLPCELPDADRSYRLMRCDGFRVENGDGRPGVVIEPRFGRRHDQPDFLCVRFGRLRRRFVLVPVEQVTEIDPTAGVVRIRPMRHAD